MGAIRIYRVASGYRARVLVRDPDGRTREMKRTGGSRAAAQRALKEAFRDRVGVDAGTDITSETRVRELAEAWFASLEQQSPTTRQSYRNRVDKQILPALGELRLRELSIGTVDRFLKTVTKRSGPAMAKMTRSVLSGMCGMAARHDALDRNPVRDAQVISQPRKAAPKSLTVKEVRQLRALMTYDDKAVERDLPEFVSFMLASGLRIGEASAVTWSALDLDAGTVEVRGTVVRLRCRGLVLMPTTKSGRSSRPWVSSSSESARTTVSVDRRVTLLGVSTATRASVKSLSVNRPANLLTNDVLLAVVVTPSSQIPTAPSGWTRVRTDVSGNAVRQSVYVRRVSASEPASYSWSVSGEDDISIAVLGYRGADGTMLPASGGSVTASSTLIPAASVATTAGYLLVSTFAVRGTASLTEPATYDARARLVSPTSRSTTLLVTDAVATTTGSTTLPQAVSAQATTGLGASMSWRVL